VAIAYFYFDFSDPQKQIPELMIRSLIFQLLKNCNQVPTTLETLFSACENGRRQPALDNLLEVLHQVVQEPVQSYLILDALDECSQRAELMNTLESITGWQLEKLHLLVTSRKERDIEVTPENLIEDRNIICLESGSMDIDIQRYVHQRLSSDKKLEKWQKDSSIAQEIETVLTRGAQEMYAYLIFGLNGITLIVIRRFRWAVCQLDALSKCLSPAMLRKALADLPPTLDATYERILCSIQDDCYSHALCILQWLASSARAVSIEEIAEAIAIDVCRPKAFDQDEVLADPLDVLEIFSSLVTIAATKSSYLTTSSSTKRVVLLAHYSVKEFLISERILRGPAARHNIQGITCNEFIAKSCVGYLLQFKEPDALSIEIINQSKLARYSAQFWIPHAQELLSTENGAHLSWIRIFNPDTPGDFVNLNRRLENVPLPLYYASLSGLIDIVRILLLK
jgi:hypothetical protein